MQIPAEGLEKARSLKARLGQALTREEWRDCIGQLFALVRSWGRQEARRFFEQMLDEARRADNPGLVAGACGYLAETGILEGRLAEAEQLLGLVRQVARDSGHWVAVRNDAKLSGMLHQARGDYAHARRCYEEYVRLCREVGDRGHEMAGLEMLGVLSTLQHNPAEALEYYHQALRLCEERGDAFARTGILQNIGAVLVQLGNWEKATEYLYRTITACEQLGREEHRLYAVVNLAELSAMRNKLDQAAAVLKEVIPDIRVQAGHQPLYHHALGVLGWTHFLAGDLAAAENVYLEARELCVAADNRCELAVLCWRRAELARARGQLAAAEELLRHGQELACQLGLRNEEGQVLRVRALTLMDKGDADGVRDSFGRAEAILADVGDNFELAQCRLQFGRWLMDVGESPAARVKLDAASETFRRLGAVGGLEEANRLVFQLGLRADREAALTGGLVRLRAMRMDPLSFLDRALLILSEALDSTGGVILHGDRPVAVRGQPDVHAAVRMARLDSPTPAPGVLVIPVRQAGEMLGTVYLERRNDDTFQPGPKSTEAAAEALADALGRAARLPYTFREAEAEVPGLVYRGVVGRNPAVMEGLRAVCRVASTSVPVLVRGESGTGKELVARALHESGDRADGPFVPVNCAAVPDSLLEAEFFGIEKGTATGVTEREGRFEHADGGTVFLDEIGDMSVDLQARLLRVLQDHTFERVGGREPVDVDIRIVAATNKDLASLLHRGEFRQDLYFRLNACEITLPSLRERREDIPALARYFLSLSSREFRRDVRDLTRDCLDCLAAYSWPGNIRELRHVIEQAVLLAHGDVLEVEDLPHQIQKTRESEQDRNDSRLRATRRDERRAAAAQAEKNMILDHLTRADWNVSRAAELAGYSRSRFYALLKKHGIPAPRAERRTRSKQ